MSTAPRSNTPLRTATPQQLRTMIDDRGELAVLDVREEGVFARGHLFRACSVPLSSLEMKIARLVPRAGTRIVLCDGDDGLAGRAAEVLRSFGYTDVSALAGGAAAWRAAGYELFTGVFVPSKAFGEFIEHRDGTPSVPPEELKRRMDAGTDMVILDSRPMAEYHLMNIPTALDCPGAELVYRVHQVVERPSTLVVVNCAGRTRSIIGAQSLINAGIPNEVIALRNGTMGWHLAGFELERGNARMAPLPDRPALQRAREAAARVAKRFGVTGIDRTRLAQLTADTSRTLYCFDVRDPEEFKRGSLPGFSSAPGGQLVQATDAYMATQNARVVLLDTDGVRAVMTASWLRQMGIDTVHVLEGVTAADCTAPGPATRLPQPAPALVSAQQLRGMIEAKTVTVIDVGQSLQFRNGHVPGASWGMRARLAVAYPRLERSPNIVFTSADGVLAQWAAADAGHPEGVAVAALEEGTAGWKRAGFELEAGDARMLDAAEDMWYRPYDKKDSIENSMRDYLSWEVELIEQIKREGVKYPQFA